MISTVLNAVTLWTLWWNSLLLVLWLRPSLRPIVGQHWTIQAGVPELCGGGRLWHIRWHRLWQKYCPHQGLLPLFKWIQSLIRPQLRSSHVTWLCYQGWNVSPSQCGTEMSPFLVLSLLQKFLCVSDLARKDKRVLSKKYQIYFWWDAKDESLGSDSNPEDCIPTFCAVIHKEMSLLTITVRLITGCTEFISVMMSFWNALPSRNISTIAVFYALPVIQLVITYQTVHQWRDDFKDEFCVLVNQLWLFSRWST